MEAGLDNPRTSRSCSSANGGGFDATAEIHSISARSRAASPRDPAIAYCQGTPLRNEIEARDGAALATATDVAARAIEARFGAGPVDGKIQANVIVVPTPFRRP